MTINFYTLIHRIRNWWHGVMYRYYFRRMINSMNNMNKIIGEELLPSIKNTIISLEELRRIIYPDYVHYYFNEEEK